MRHLATLFLAIFSLACWQAQATVLTLTSPNGFPATGASGVITGSPTNTIAFSAGTFSGTPSNGTVVTGTGLAASAPWNYLTGCTGTTPNFTCAVNGPAVTTEPSESISLFYGYQMPSNWVNAGSQIEVVSAGGFGHNSTSGNGSGGSGGGNYAKSLPTSGYTLTASSFYPYSIGTSAGPTATTGATWFNGVSATSASVGFQGGQSGGTTTGGGAGGLGNGVCVGTSCVKEVGAAGGTGGTTVGAGGGGGAGGTTGGGSAGASGVTETGSAGGGAGGAGGATGGGAGGSGSNSVVDCGIGVSATYAGGGGGGGSVSHPTGCSGGSFGGGAGGCYSTSCTPGTGGPAEIIITYTPSGGAAFCTLAAEGAGPC